MTDAARQSRYLKEPDGHYLENEFQSLMQTRSKLQKFLLEDAFDGFRFWDLQNREHEWISPGFWHALGYAPEAMPHIAAAWRSIVDPKDYNHAMAAIEKYCADPRRPFDETVRFKHAQGHTIWFRCRATAIRDDSGAPARMLTACINVTDLKTNEQKLEDECAQLRRRANKLSTNNQGLKEFAAIVAHDLNSPLRQTKMQLSLLEADVKWKPALNKKMRNAMDSMEATLDRMQRIVRSLHELYRLDAFDLELRSTPIGVVVDEAIAKTKIALGARGAQVNKAPLPTLAIDRDLVTQVFQHLLKNACEHSDSNALSINISSERDDARKRVLIYVDNNGAGIPEGCEENVFEPYKRLADTDGGEGAGIGLALCRRMMMLHRGTAYVDPHFKNGARIVLSFPDADTEIQTPTETDVPRPAL